MEQTMINGGGRVEELKKKVDERVTSSRDKMKTRKRSLLLNTNKKKSRRFLISVAVRGSIGPIRFVANQNDTVTVVIRACLERYAREGRLPAVGRFDVHDFLLYCPHVASEALSPGEAIGECGGRYFVLSKKQEAAAAVMGRAEIVGDSGCKVWLFKSLFVQN